MSKLTNKEYPFLLRRKDFLDNERLKLARSLDKYLLSFSTGGLYLIIITISKYGPGEMKIFIEYLCFGAILLFLSVTTSLFSIYFAYFGYNKSVQEIKEEMINNSDKKIFTVRDNTWNKIAGIMQSVSIFTFIFGLVFIFIFFYANIL